GPENSLTIWEDQGDGEILCDYGAAYTIMELLAGRYGTDFMSALHRGDANGLGGLQEALSALRGRKTFAQDVLHDWSLMVALDGLIDDGARIDGNIKERDVTAPTLDATINWDSPHAYDTPGAPPNGADYVRLRDASGTYLRGSQIESLGFQGASTLPTRPVMWTVDPNPPGHTGNPALYSGTGNNRDEAIVRQVTVPTGPGANVTFDARWNLEEDADGGWDFAFVQISTDGGASYQSVACTSTTTDHNPSAIASVVENLPGYTGDSGGWSAETCGLSAYAGQTVHLAFRVINDPSVEGTDPAIPAGFWVDNIAVGAFTSDGSSLAGWQSPTEVRPNTVAGFTVYLISQRGNRILVRQLKLDNAFAVQGFAHIQKYVDRRADFVAAIVFYDDPSERSTQYAPYQLTVNGVVQPGGS
ncbi:MAG: peptidase M6, partial [Gaiellaceae bacterium]